MEQILSSCSAVSAEENMQSDYRALLNLKEGDKPVLRIYEWEKPSFTYGYFLKPEEWLDMEALKNEGFDFARRPTGGGVLFHTHDVAFSILIPKGHPLLSDNTLANYKLINSIVQTAIKPYVEEKDPSLLACCQEQSFFCMAKPTIYDVMIGNKKVGGAAERRTKSGLLHQGTICVSLPNFDYLQSFFKDQSIPKAMQNLSYPLNCDKELIKTALKRSFDLVFTAY